MASRRRVHLGEWLRQHREQVLAAWEQSARATSPKARRFDRSRLLNHLPLLLDAIAADEDRAESGEPPQAKGLPATIHALDRLGEGYDLEELTAEYGQLRRCVLDLLEGELPELPRGELTLLNGAIDEAVTRAVKSYSDMRERTFRSLERLNAAAVASADLDTLLDNLIFAMLDSTPVVDSVIILLLERGELVVRAAAGPGQADIEGFAPKHGTVSWLVANSREPIFISDAAKDPRISSPAIRAAGIHGMYVMPLLAAGEVVGVATAGSTTAYEFSREDLLLFRTLANRASSLIIKGRLHAELIRAENNYRALADAMPQIVWTANSACELDYVNRRAEEYSGAPREAWLGTGWHSFLHPDDRERVMRACATAIRDRRDIEIEERLRGRDGKYRWFLKRAAPKTDEVDGTVRWVGTTTDIDDQKRTQHDQQERAEFGEQVLGIVSHDLRTPLTAIAVSAQMLNRGSITVDQKRAVRRILSSSARAERLIRDLLDLTRVRTGHRIEIQRSPTDFVRVLDLVVDEIRGAHPDRPVSVDHPASLIGEWDQVRIAQLVSNLLGNAIQHSPNGTPVEVRCSGSEAEVVLTIHNWGAPIPPELFPRLFEPMTRGRKVPSTGGSVGLGLFIVDRVVAAHGGRVEVSSTAEGGTTFKVTLPRAASPSAGAAPAATSP